jgi:hypothetical protein
MSSDTKVLQLSTGVVLASNLSAKTNRRIVEDGNATVITPGTTGFDVVRLKNSTRDTQFSAATSGSPVLLGVDNVLFIPLQYPEGAGQS